jgi:hypothetical protein
MAIRVTHGAEAVGATAFAVGQAQKRAEEAARDIERAGRAAAQIRQLQHQEEMKEYEVELRMEQEKRSLERQIMAEDRKEDWEIEKMSLRSQQDFLDEERDRKIKLDRISVQEKALDEYEASGKGNEEELALKRFDLYRARVAAERNDPAPTQLTKLPGEEFGVKPWYADPEDVSPEAKAARARAARIPEGTSVFAKKSADVARLDRMAKAMAPFAENKDINPGWGEKIVDLAVEVKQGDRYVWVEATPQEKFSYEQTKALFEQQQEQESGVQGGYPDFVSVEEQGVYDALLQRGWTKEQIRERLSR